MNKFMGVDVGKIKGLSKTKDPDFALYVARVISDGGVIIDYDYLHRSITHAKDNGYWSSLKFWTSPSFGVKKDGSNAVSKMYCLKSNDAIQTTGAYQPIWTANQKNNRPGIVHTRASGHNFLLPVGFNLSDTQTIFLSFINIGTLPAYTYIFSRCTNANVWATFAILSNGTYLIQSVTSNDHPNIRTIASIPSSCIISATYNWPTSKHWVNGSSLVTLTNSYHYNLDSGRMAIGQNGLYHDYIFGGTFGDILMTDNTMSDTTRTAFESYQNAFYAIY